MNVKNQKKNGKFFSFTTTPLLIEILKEKGYEDYILFDEKNCCKEMSQNLLKAISYISKKYNSKSSIWYRNFLVKKYNKIDENKINRKIYRTSMDKINERFYLTFLSSAVLKKSINYETFIKEENKKLQYYKYYTQLDKELKTQTRLYDLNTAQYHIIKENRKTKIYEEGMAYLNSDVKIKIEHVKDEKWSYKKALAKQSNKKYNEKMKKTITNLLKTKKIITMDSHRKEINKLRKEIGKDEDKQIISVEEDIENINKIKEEIINDNIEKIKEKREELYGSDSSESFEDSSDEDFSGYSS